MESIIARLEAGETGREVDLAIFEAVHPGEWRAAPQVSQDSEYRIYYAPDGQALLSTLNRPPPFSTSFDVALMLVPEGCWAEGSLGSPASIEIHSPTVYDPVGGGKAPTPAAALCIAALEAIGVGNA